MTTKKHFKMGIDLDMNLDREQNKWFLALIIYLSTLFIQFCPDISVAGCTLRVNFHSIPHPGAFHSIHCPGNKNTHTPKKRGGVGGGAGTCNTQKVDHTVG